MNVVVIYESMSGSTHAIADAIGAGLNDGNEVLVVPAAGVSPDTVAGADLVVVGAPTADGPGLNEWFASLGMARVLAAAFDTRLAGIAALTGRASLGIQRELLRHGFLVVDLPHSFLVGGDHKVRPGEVERARLWGEQLAGRLRARRSYRVPSDYAIG
jgi:flavorubredoxin